MTHYTSLGADKASTKTSVPSIDYLQTLIKEVGGTGLTIFIDDFHYIPKAAQGKLAKEIKEAIRNDVRFICASVPYHADDIIRSNSDLRVRVFSIDFEYWGQETLQKIAVKGFEQLNVKAANAVVAKLATEAAGSPQLMQYLCLNSCHELGIRERPADKVEFLENPKILDNVCRRTVQSTDYGSVVAKMKEGPKTRGSDRKIYLTIDGWQGDVYKLLTRALSLDPPQLTFRYQSLMDRIASLCSGAPPSGSSITSACQHSANIVNGSTNERVVEWDAENDVFDIRDPYLLFYLRWSEKKDD